MSAERIISLLPSATEIVGALGLADCLIGRSHECDFPSGVAQLPVCTAPKIDVAGTSGAIDRRVKELVELGLSVYRVDADGLRALAPDLIVTQSQCEVCAVSEEDVEAAVADWVVGQRPRIVSLKPDALSDVWRDIQNVAVAAGVAERGADLVDGLQARMRKIQEAAAAAPTRPRVACVEWIDPLMAAGNWMPELVELAGGENLFGVAGQHSPWMEWDALKAADPDVIVVLPCGFDMARSRSEMPALTAQPGWQELAAVRTGRVFITDGNQFFNRPGPRLVESLEILAELLHPDRFSFGHEGVGWTRL